MKKFLAFLSIISIILFLSCAPNSDSGNNTTPNTPPTTTPTDPNTPTGPATPPAITPSTNSEAAQIIKAMGAGWNLGNTLDANTENTSQTGSNEVDWGMPATTKLTIKTVKDAGFKHIRIPISWHNHYSDGKINEGWLNHVKQIVDWCIENELYVIINIHHDNYKEGSGSFWGFYVDDAHKTQSLAYVENIWNQVATYFKDYDQHLVFETLNEPRIRDGSHANGDGFWCDTYMANNQTGNCNTCTNVAKAINELNQKALTTIRATGGNNTKRLVIVPGTAASPDYAFRDDFKMPTDSVSNLLALSVHMYTPNEFAFAPEVTSTPTFKEEHKTTLNNYFNKLKTKFIDKGYPVFIGEYSATNKNNSAERVKWAKYFVAGAAAKDMAYCLWDNNVYTGGENASEQHGHLNRSTLTWYDEDFIKAVTGVSSISTTPSSPPTPPPAGATALGLNGFDNWGKNYTISDKSATGVTITHSDLKSIATYDCCGADIDFTSKTKVELKVKNNSSLKAYVKIAIKNQAWSSEKGEHENKAGLSSATINGAAVPDVTYGALAEIEAGDTATFVLMLNTTLPVADKFVVSLNSESGSMPTSGSITISEAYMY